MEISEKAILIRPSKRYHDRITPTELPEITRGAWKVGERRNEADLAFVVIDGIVKEVYRIKAWVQAGTLKYETCERSEVKVPDKSMGSDSIDSIEKGKGDVTFFFLRDPNGLVSLH